MSTIQFDNVEYTKASDVAKQFGYTADYIGQLCRARKISARLVGRTWFVHVPSLLEHRKTKYKATQLENVTGESETAEQSRFDASDMPSKKYLRRVPAPEAKIRRIVQRTDEAGSLRHVSLSYEPDDNSLIPRILHSPKVTLLKVGIADAEQLKVTSTAHKTTNLSPTALPDVALSGTLRVMPISDAEEEASKGIETETEVDVQKISDSRDKPDNNNTLNEIEESTYAVPLKVSHSVAAKSPVSRELKPARPILKKSNPAVHVARKASVLAVSTVTEDRPVHHQMEILVADANESSVPSPVNIIFLTASLFLALAISVGVMATEQVVLATTESTESQVEFHLSNISNIASILFTVE